MKKQYLLLVFLAMLMTSGLKAQSEDFKIVGYLPYWRFSLADQIQFEKLTHVNLAFANPDMSGQLDFEGLNIDPVIAMAHEEDVDVFISLAGGALTPSWAAAWEHLQKVENRSAFIHKIIQYLMDHDLQGVDVDLEWSHVQENYSGFVLELKDSLDVYGFPMTAALPGTTRFAEITDEALEAFDWINMMVYDLTGSWAPDSPGPHSPYSFAISSINHWLAQGVSKDLLTLGVPFYGYDFDPPGVSAFTYGSMVAEDEDYAYLDQVGLAYYNGIPTIQDKTELALEQLAGIMIWELGQDAFNEYSLLSTIYDVVISSTGTTEQEARELQVYPNPVGDLLFVDLPEIQDVELVLFDLNGKLVLTKTIDNTVQEMDLSGLNPGFYTIQIRNSEVQFTGRLVKI